MLRGEPFVNPGSGRSVGGLFPNGIDFAHAPVRVAASPSTLLIEPSASRTGEAEDKVASLAGGVNVDPGYEKASGCEGCEGGEGWKLFVISRG